ncbi:hypothetical protein, partial [Paenibacillus thermotolerans]|uniref:hypothetical protein n=1 Tax=Paenibacillus thermotolerans TaxID=3027807 RepID=UPI002368BB91
RARCSVFKEQALLLCRFKPATFISYHIRTVNATLKFLPDGVSHSRSKQQEIIYHETPVRVNIKHAAEYNHPAA